MDIIDAFGFNINNQAGTESYYVEPELNIEIALESDINEINYLIKELEKIELSEMYESGTEAVAKDRSLGMIKDAERMNPNDTDDSSTSNTSKTKYSFNAPSSKKERLFRRILEAIKRFFKRLFGLFKRKDSFLSYSYVEFMNIKVRPGYEKFEFDGIPYKWLHEYIYSMKSMLNGVKHTSNFMRSLHKIQNVNEFKEKIDAVDKEIANVHFIADKPTVQKISADEISKGSEILRKNRIDKDPVFEYLAEDGERLDDWFAYKGLKPEAREAGEQLSSKYYEKFKNIGMFLLQIRNVIIATQNAFLKEAGELIKKYGKDRKFLRAFQPVDKKKATIGRLMYFDINIGKTTGADRRFNRDMYKHRSSMNATYGIPTPEESDDDFTPEFK